MSQSLMTYEDLVAVKQQRNELAVRQGLPAIGSRMVNQFGIEWIVDAHIYAPCLNAVERDSGQPTAQHPQDLLPRITPQNASQRLQNFWVEVDRCTCKEMVVLDTMPHARPTHAHTHGHWVDAWSYPDAIIFFLDAAHIDEAIFAHELGHVWLDRVEGCEDYRVFRDLGDTQRVRLLQYVQSFVLDRKVNTLLLERGFDLTVIEQHERENILDMAQALLLGYCPPLAREAGFATLVIATALLESNADTESSSQSLVLCYDGTVSSALQTIKQMLPDVYAVSENLAEIIRRHGCEDRHSVLKAIDECIGEVFTFTGDPIDLENELIEEPPTEIKRDKWPEMLSGWSVEAKLEVGRVMAKQGIGAQVNMQLSYTPFGMAQVVFQKPNGETTAPMVLQHAPTLPPQELPAFAAPVPQMCSPLLQPQSPSVPAKFQHLITQAAQTKKPHLPSPQAANIPAPPMPIDPAQLMRGWPQRNQGRDYLAGVGRWMSSVRLAEQMGENLEILEYPYAYVQNNPVSYADPDGLKPRPVIPAPTPPKSWIGDIWGKIQGHGSYCGGDRSPASAARRNHRPIPSTVDGVDACCKIHDDGVNKCKCFGFTALPTAPKNCQDVNWNLCECLLRADCTFVPNTRRRRPQAAIDACETYREKALFAFCSFGLKRKKSPGYPRKLNCPPKRADCPDDDGALI